MNDVLQTVFITLGSGAVTGLFAVVGMRVDINWIKEVIKDHSERIKQLEGKRQCLRE